jgi:hypothetical protein
MNYIPETIEADTYVRGRLVPVELARSVRRGWKTGIANLAVLLLSLVFSTVVSGAQTVPLVIGVLDILVVAALVWGVRRWSLLAASLLVAHPILSTLVVAATAPHVQSAGMQPGGLRIVFLVVFLYAFGKAAIAIHKLGIADQEIPPNANASVSVPKTMDEAMAATAECAVRMAAETGIRLDYSNASIEAVERQLAGLHDQLQASKLDSMRSPPPSEREFQAMCFYFGTYIAEVLRRTYGGTWSNQSALHPGHEIPTFHVGASRMEIWPQIKVEKRLRNGPEDNVWHYFQLTVQRLAAQ